MLELRSMLSRLFRGTVVDASQCFLHRPALVDSACVQRNADTPSLAHRSTTMEGVAKMIFGRFPIRTNAVVGEGFFKRPTNQAPVVKPARRNTPMAAHGNDAGKLAACMIYAGFFGEFGAVASQRFLHRPALGTTAAKSTRVHIPFPAHGVLAGICVAEMVCSNRIAHGVSLSVVLVPEWKSWHFLMGLLYDMS